MTEERKRVLVVAPGRGSYNKTESGYLSRRAQQIPQGLDILKSLDQMRAEQGLPTLTELDQSDYKTKLHPKGEHASVLIWACSLMDYLSIDSNQFEVVGMVGNSMGWYITLSLSGALPLQDAFRLIQTIGSLMQAQAEGGQVIYPLVDENWRENLSLQQELELKIKSLLQDPEMQIYDSIYLGGYRVWGGNKKGISALLQNLPQTGDYPFQLLHHGAYHTPLMEPISKQALQLMSFPSFSFQPPQFPIIDGRGFFWSDYNSHLEDLYQYTLGHQITQPYDFTKSVEVALKELAPDQVFLLGPGNSLGGVLGQILIQNQWRGLHNKTEFQELQKTRTFLNSMGLSL